MDPWVAGLLGVLLGCAMGLFNAVLVQFIAIPAIIATLATLSMYRGLSQALSDGQQVTGLPAQNSFFTFLGGDKLGLPVSVWILILVTIVLTVVLASRPTATGSAPSARTPRRPRSPASASRACACRRSSCSARSPASRACSPSPSSSPATPTSAPASSCRRSPPSSSAARRSGAAAPPSSAPSSEPILLSAVNSGLAYFDVPVNWSSFATGAVILTAVALDSLIRGRRRHARQGLDL